MVVLNESEVLFMLVFNIRHTAILDGRSILQRWEAGLASADGVPRNIAGIDMASGTPQVGVVLPMYRE